VARFLSGIALISEHVHYRIGIDGRTDARYIAPESEQITMADKRITNGNGIGLI